MESQNSSDYVMMVSGYRYFHDYDFFSAKMDEILKIEGIPSKVVQGKCETGVDQLCIRWCKERDIKCDDHPAHWSIGKYAGPKRNLEMIKIASVVVAFLHKDSKGTKNTVETARKRKKKLYVVKIEQ